MKAGIYHVKFSAAASHNFGEGLVVFKDGTINGGDLGYLYTGSYQLTAPKLTARLKVKRWNQAVVSVFGNFPEFDLELSGDIPNDWNSFAIKGVVAQNPQMQITISCRRLADAV